MLRSFSHPIPDDITNIEDCYAIMIHYHYICVVTLFSYMKKILVVDDESDIAVSIRNGLQRKGFQVDTYTDPLKALSEFDPKKYDLVLLDIRMPKMNGFELYREILKCNSKVRVCFFTAFVEYHDEFKKAFPELDESRFIKKPTTLTALTERLLQELEIPLNA